MDAHYWGENHFLISSHKMTCKCLWLASCSSQTVQRLWLLSSQFTPGPKGVGLFPSACCNMLWFIPASYERQGMEGCFVSSPQHQGAAPKADKGVWWSAPNECDGQRPPEKRNCFSLLLQVWPYYQLKLWDYFKHSIIFKFTRPYFQVYKHKKGK